MNDNNFCLNTFVYQQVHGEIYEVDSNVLSSLDELEGHPTWLKRTPCKIITTKRATGIEAGDVISCSAYFLTDFTEKFLSQEFLSEYILEYHLKTYIEGSSKDNYCDVRGQSQVIKHQ